MNSQTDNHRVGDARASFDILQGCLNDLPGSKRDAAVSALQAMGASLEELQVAEEELRQQNEELFESQRALDEQRQRYQDLFEFAPDGYLVTDAVGVIREANRASANLLGIGADRLIGKEIAQYIQPAGRATFQAALGRLEDDTFHDWYVRMRSHNSRPFEANVKVASIRDESGRLRELRWLVRDVTEHSVADERIRTSERQLAEAQQIAHVGSWHWDIGANVVRWTDELYRIYGLSRAERNLSFDDFLNQVHPSERDFVRNTVTATLRERATFAIDHRIVRPDGGVRTLHARGEVVTDGLGNPISMRGTGQDVTELRNVEAQIRHLNLQLEQRVAERTAQLEAINQDLSREVSEHKQTEAALRESEARFRLMADTAPVLIWTADAGGQRDFFNRPWLSFTGRTMQQELGDGWMSGVYPDDLQRCLDTFMTALSARQEFKMEFRLRRADGEYGWVFDNGVPRYGPDGEFAGYIGSCIDIGDRKQTEQALRDALERTRELYQISRLIALVRTPADVLRALILSNYLRRINRAAILLFDHPWQDQVPEQCRALASWRNNPDLLSIEGREFPFGEYGFEGLFAPDQPVNIPDVEADSRVNARLRGLFAQLKTRSVTLFPLVASGQWYGVLSLHAEAPGAVGGEDMRHMRGLADQAAVAIHNIRLLEAEAQARREAEAAGELKLKFLAMISHELRTPLTSIKGFATTLLANDVTWDEDNQREFISTINEEADKLTEMIEQLLDLSRLQAGTLRIQPERLKISDIVGIATAQLQAITRNHRLAVDVPGDLPAVNADRQRVAQVLTNLVDNAAKYSPPGSAVFVSARATGPHVEVSVRDEGVGIPSSERQHVFEAFRRGNGEQTNRTKGAGLGLAICQHLIEAHDGKIWVEEHEGPGTVMVFTLPIVPG